MASNNDVSSQIPVLSRLDRLEKIAGGFDSAVRKTGLWQKAIHKTTTFFLEKLATSAESMEQLSRIFKDADKTALGNAFAGTVRNRVQAYSNLAKKTLFQFPERQSGGNKQQATGYYPAPELKIDASAKLVEQVAIMSGKSAGGLKSESVNLFRSRLISPENETAKNAVSKNGGQKTGIEKIIDASPQIVKNRGYLNLIADRIDTAKSKITGFQGKGIRKLQQLADVPVPVVEKTTKNQLLTEQLQPEKGMEVYDDRKIQENAATQQLYNRFTNTNVDDIVKYPNDQTTASNSLVQTLTETENAAESISATGRQVKNYNITINDGLIRQVDNHFSSTGESPESASDFMAKLSDSLRMILNDVNYATV